MSWKRIGIGMGIGALAGILLSMGKTQGPSYRNGSPYNPMLLSERLIPYSGCYAGAGALLGGLLAYLTEK